MSDKHKHKHKKMEKIPFLMLMLILMSLCKSALTLFVQIILEGSHYCCYCCDKKVQGMRMSRLPCAFNVLLYLSNDTKSVEL